MNEVWFVDFTELLNCIINKLGLKWSLISEIVENSEYHQFISNPPKGSRTEFEIVKSIKINIAKLTSYGFELAFNYRDKREILTICFGIINHKLKEKISEPYIDLKHCDIFLQHIKYLIIMIQKCLSGLANILTSITKLEVIFPYFKDIYLKMIHDPNFSSGRCIRHSLEEFKLFIGELEIIFIDIQRQKEIYIQRQKEIDIQRQKEIDREKRRYSDENHRKSSRKIKKSYPSDEEYDDYRRDPYESLSSRKRKKQYSSNEEYDDYRRDPYESSRKR